MEYQQQYQQQYPNYNQNSQQYDQNSANGQQGYDQQYAYDQQYQYQGYDQQQQQYAYDQQQQQQYAYDQQQQQQYAYDQQQQQQYGYDQQQQQQYTYDNNQQQQYAYDNNQQYAYDQTAQPYATNDYTYDYQQQVYDPNAQYPPAQAASQSAAPNYADASSRYIQTPNQRYQVMGNPPLEPSTPTGDTQGASRKDSASSRIDPRQIPRPAYSAEPAKYYTRSGVCPPPSASQFSVVDEGNCSPRFMRLTTYHIPNTNELVDTTRVCIGAVIQPLANVGRDEEPVPVVDFGGTGPIRCTRCKAYMNPFFKFIDAGRSFICNLCDMKNEVPREYQCNLDANGLRRDRNDRPELCRGSVEYVATQDYLARPIQDPCFLFLIDVSYSSVVTGLLHVATQSIRNCLDAVAANPRARVGVITYDSTLQFYRVKPPLKAPSMMVVSDIANVFVPAPLEELLVTVADPGSRVLLDQLLDMIPRIFAENRNEGNCLGAAVQAGCEVLNTFGGKLLVVQSNLPSTGPGALRNRDDITLYGTDREKTLYVPQSTFYETLAATCAEAQISVDMFTCPNSYVDLASTGALCSTTGGQQYFYPGFHARKDGEAFQQDLYHNLTRATGFEAVMTVRTSNGLRVSEYYGHFFRRMPTEMEMASIDSDKTFAIRLQHDFALKDQSEACIQCALLYTTAEGQRRIRVHTISVPVTAIMGTTFRNADIDAIINISLKQAVTALPTTNVSAARTAIVQACVDILHVYRKKCATASSSGQLILPETLKLLPLYTLSMIKNQLLQDGQRSDDRSFLCSHILSMPTNLCIPFVYPHLYCLNDLTDNWCVMYEDGRFTYPPLRTLSELDVVPEGILLLDTGRQLYLYLGEQVQSDLLMDLFEISDPEQKVDATLLKQYNPETPTSLASRINLLLDGLRQNRANYPSLQVLRRTPAAVHGGNRNLDEAHHFMSLLLEDGIGDKDKEAATATADKLSYVAFLCYIHRKIQDRFV